MPVAVDLGPMILRVALAPGTVVDDLVRKDVAVDAEVAAARLARVASALADTLALLSTGFLLAGVACGVLLLVVFSLGLLWEGTLA